MMFCKQYSRLYDVPYTSLWIVFLTTMYGLFQAHVDIFSKKNKIKKNGTFILLDFTLVTCGYFENLG